MRRLLFTASLAATLMFGASAWTHANAQASGAQSPNSSAPSAQAPGSRPETQAPSSQTQAQSPDSRSQAAQQGTSVNGKVTSVSGRNFTLEVGEGSSKHSLQFTTDANTAMSGQLKEGSDATVQYRSGANNQNMATKVDIE